mgnify:CR=1 FL=1
MRRIFPVTVFKIEGESMLPDFHPGDFIILNRWAYTFGVPKIGDCIALKDPRENGLVLIKRVSGVKKDGIFFRGDNSNASTDSRTIGAVARKAIIGKVLARIGK